MPGQGEQAHPREEVVRDLHDEQPQAVLGEALQGQVPQSGVFGDADTVLAPGATAVA